MGDHKTTSVSKTEKLEAGAGSDLCRVTFVGLVAQRVLGSRFLNPTCLLVSGGPSNWATLFSSLPSGPTWL